MSVDSVTVRHIARLARISVSEEEVARLAPELSNILGWIEQLQEVDVAGVEPMTAVIPNKQRLRDDVVTEGGIRDAALDRMVPELNGILAWVEQLGEVDCTGVEPMTAVIPNKLRLREDVVDADPLTGGGVRDKVLANAPAAEHGFFGVPKVIE